MSYVRHNWVTDESITAAKLNNMEDGIEEAAQSGGSGGGLTFVPVTWNGENSQFVMGMTFAQLMAGMISGTMYAVNIDSTLIPEGWGFPPQVFLIYGLSSDGNYTQMETGCNYSWSAATENDYPVCYIGD